MGSRDDEAEWEFLFPAVYDELKELARQKMRQEPAGHTLQTTALVHEAYLRLHGDAPEEAKGRAYFFGAAAEAMRRILVERARRVRGAKRGGDRDRVDLDLDRIGNENSEVDLCALDEALTRLAEIDPRKCEVVKLHYFVGLTVAETASILGIATRTVDQDWRLARAWLRRELAEPE